MMITNILFKFHRKKWSRLFEDVTNIDTFGKPANFDKVKSQCIFLSKLYTIYCIIGTIVYTCISVLESSCEDPNEGIERKSICGTISPIWLPVENVSTATRNLILLIQYILGNYMVIPPAIITFLVFETTELLICHIGFLKENILESLQCEKEELESNRLRFCITYHNHILRMANQLNYVVKFNVGHMSLICAMVFGCLGNQIFKTKPVGAAIFLFGYIVSLFLLCYAGQRITNESLSVAEVIYQSKWYEANTQMKKSILFSLARCQIPLTLDAWPLGNFCFPLFMMIVKTSYSYLMLLQQTI
ncbi:odorant receptor 4-like [Leptinotarsa decemlineata]|uniref:odorant receptor 4-like n=1 Tax=Leptinotarsa decemlineata TaxID=7539 RepID=UPI003D309A17